MVEKIKILEIIKDNGIRSVPLNTALNGGLWDGNGNVDFGEPAVATLRDPVTVPAE